MLYISALLALLSITLWRRTLQSRFFSAKVAVAAFMFFFISGFYFVSNHLTDSGINEAVLYHLGAEMEGADYAAFAMPIAMSSVYMAVILVLSFIVYKTTYAGGKLPRKNARAFLALCCLMLAFFLNPGVADICTLYQSFGTENTSSNPPVFYTKVDNISFKGNKKNIVYIYLESLERTYFDEKLFPGLLHNLKRIEKEALSFTDLTQVYGSEWTIAGMVSTQCGVPLVTPSHGNSMSGVDMFLPEAVCIGDLLNKHDYGLNYLGGANLDFAGKGNFYKTHGFDLVQGRQELTSLIEDPNYMSGWGLYDDSLLDIAKKRYDELADKSQPFGLFILTLDTHHPTGHMSKSCANVQYGDGKNPILNAIQCTDRTVADLIKHIRSSKAYQDTIIVISSDHLAMRNTAYSKLEQGQRRNLWMVLGDTIKPAQIDKKGSMLDAAPTLLNLLGTDVETFGLGQNLLSDKKTLTAKKSNVNAYLRQQRNFLSSLWDFPHLKDGLHLESKTQEVFLGDRKLRYPALFLLNADNSIDKIMFEFYTPEQLNLASKVSKLDFSQKFIWIDKCRKIYALDRDNAMGNDGDCLASGTLGSPHLTILKAESNPQLSFDKIQRTFRKDFVNKRIASLRAKQLKNRGEVNPLDAASIKGDNVFLIQSSGGIKSSSAIITPESTSSLNLSRGVTLVGFKKGSCATSLVHLDTYVCSVNGKTESGYSLQKYLHSNRKEFDAFAVIVHDSAVGEQNHLEKIFAGTGLKKWRDLDFREPYIGIIKSDGSLKEFSEAPEKHLTYELIL